MVRAWSKYVCLLCLGWSCQSVRIELEENIEDENLDMHDLSSTITSGEQGKSNVTEESNITGSRDAQHARTGVLLGHASEVYSKIRQVTVQSAEQTARESDHVRSGRENGFSQDTIAAGGKASQRSANSWQRPGVNHVLTACAGLIVVLVLLCLYLWSTWSTRQHSAHVHRRNPKSKIVMEKFSISMVRDDVLGESRCAICRRGSDLLDGKDVVFKVYRGNETNTSQNDDALSFKRFQWQIKVLQALHGPCDAFSVVEELSAKHPSDLFVKLYEFSRNAQGEPSVDTAYGYPFVVLEAGQYSLADYLAARVDFHNKLPLGLVQDLVKALILIIAGLHAKGFVNLNLKPDSFVAFSGRLKLVSTDNCVMAGSCVSLHDHALHYSPAYCCPEWARFVQGDQDATLIATPTYDVWSLGLTICELVICDSVMKQMYSKFLTHTQSDREAGFEYTAWLSSFEKVPLPREIKGLDSSLNDLLRDWMLVPDTMKRKTVIQCLSHRYCEGATAERKLPVALLKETPFSRAEDISRKYSKKGTLWKLNTGGAASDATQWLQRDMWVTAAGSLCYFSIKDNKRLVLLDSGKLVGAVVSPFKGGSRKHAFQIQIRPDEDETITSAFFAADSAEECEIWMAKLQRITAARRPTQWLGGPAREFGIISLRVKNRRAVVENAPSCAAVRSQLWKVKGNGDRTKEEDWFQREMWISSDGSLAYWSEREQHDVFYYTASDLVQATVSVIDTSDSFRQWSFQVQLAPAGEVAFRPGEFAAETEEMRSRWLAALHALQEFT